MPFEPLSRKPARVVPLYVVLKVPDAFAVNTCAEPSWLLDAVPTPNTIRPVTLGTPPSGTSGNVIATPLLSVGNRATGLVTCDASGATLEAQPVAGQAKYTDGAALDTQAEPQSCLNMPTPRMPLAPGPTPML